MTGVLENKQNNALLTVFSNCSEDKKLLVEAICFDVIDDDFFVLFPQKHLFQLCIIGWTVRPF
jgi:hypothetical protein